MEKFTMIILDECHHTSKNNPYAMMMKHYLIEKHNSAAHMPQVYTRRPVFLMFHTFFNLITTIVVLTL